MVEICTVGGYSEVGKNMTAIKDGDEVILLDMGINVPKMINFEEEEGIKREKADVNRLIRGNAIPDDRFIKDWWPKVKGIVCSHCHLDHVAAIPFLADKYNCPIIGTPFTIEVIKTLLNEEGIKLRNKLIPLNAGATYKLTESIKVEFINVTHSTLQTVIIALHLKQGTILYTNDFKFDNSPVMGQKPDYKRLRQLGDENVLAVFVDSLYSNSERKTPSERVARELLKDVLLGTENHDKLIIVTTFASHLARIRSIIDFGKQLNRKIIMLGRSMFKYTDAAERIGLVKYSKEAEIISYARLIKKKLHEIEQARNKYLIICTGNQGEPESVLSRIADDKYKLKFQPEDHILFSCKTIPEPTNIKNRAILEEKLKQKKARIFTDLHASGHCGREDIRDLLKMVKPQHIFPSHGDEHKQMGTAELADEMGFELGKNVHIMQNGKRITI